jgi:hypothetical protein
MRRNRLAGSVVELIDLESQSGIIAVLLVWPAKNPFQSFTVLSKLPL